jgi:4-amino-4-deoxy-L-arabinose transferase-like glycosyltransferase
LRFIIATRLRGALVVSVIAALLLVPPVGRRLLATGQTNGDDEARYALLARDMLARGVWFDLHYRGALFRDKPPLYPWTIAAVSWVRGRVTEGTAQIPVVLAGVTAVLCTYLLGERLFTRRAGVWAALILLTTAGFLDVSQLLLPDMLVVCFATLAGCGFWRMVTEPSNRQAELTFYGATALAVFAKGPAGLFPVLAAGAWLMSEEGPRGLRRLWRPAGVGIFTAVTLAWVGPFLALGARSWLQDSVQDDWLAWYFGRPGNLDHFIPGFLTWSLPWTMVSVLAIVSAARTWQAPAVRFAFLWFAVPFVVLMFSAHQKDRYLLATYPGEALLVAWWTDVHGTKRTAIRRVIGWLTLASAAIIIVKLYVPRWWGPDDERRYLLDTPWWVLFPVAVGLGLIAGAVFVGLRLGRPTLLVHGVVIGMVAVWGYGIWPFTHRYNDIWDFRRLVAEAEQLARGGEVAVLQHRDKWMSIDFYLGRSPRAMVRVEEVNELLGRDPRSVVLMDDRTWRGIGAAVRPGIRVLDVMTIGGQDVLLVGTDGRPEPVVTGSP